MTFTTLWLRLELRRRLRSLIVLALLVALATTAVLASVAGARRGDSAVQRLRDRTLPADITVLPNQPGFDWNAVRALPEVSALTTFPVSEFAIDGIPDNAVNFPAGDTDSMRTIERPVMLHVGGPAGRVDLHVGGAVEIRVHDPQSIRTRIVREDPAHRVRDGEHPRAAGPQRLRGSQVRLRTQPAAGAAVCKILQRRSMLRPAITDAAGSVFRRHKNIS